jgi:hypothetical protein
VPVRSLAGIGQQQAIQVLVEYPLAQMAVSPKSEDVI